MNDTIAAISTSVTTSAGIGIIRLSGDSAIEIVDKIFEKANKKSIIDVPSHTAHFGVIKDKAEVIDEAIVLVMRAPKTYTTENVVEIQCHGGTYMCRRILELVLKNGAILAPPGEFTKRAFLGGRIDLTQAEAVMDIIASKNETTRKASVNQLEGKMSGKIKEIRSRILNMCAFIESALDDPEHYDINSGQIVENVDNIVEKLALLWKGVDNGHIFKEGINTVILGKPNAGKSSLLNLLSGSEKAIVTDIEGTTRDIIEEQVNIGGILLNLYDTAGIRNTDDMIESIGVERAKKAADNADLILYVCDGSKNIDDNDIEIMDIIKDKKVVILINKTDLVGDEDKIDVDFIKDKPCIHISAKTGLGLEKLEEMLMDMFTDMTDSSCDNIFFANIRQKDYLKKAIDCMALVKQSIEDEMPEDCFTIDLMEAYENLGFIIGESLSDDLANEIFSKFCMGK